MLVTKGTLHLQQTEIENSNNFMVNLRFGHVMLTIDIIDYVTGIGNNSCDAHISIVKRTDTPRCSCGLP